MVRRRNSDYLCFKTRSTTVLLACQAFAFFPNGNITLVSRTSPVMKSKRNASVTNQLILTRSAPWTKPSFSFHMKSRHVSVYAPVEPRTANLHPWEKPGSRPRTFFPLMGGVRRRRYRFIMNRSTLSFSACLVNELLERKNASKMKLLCGMIHQQILLLGYACTMD